MTIQVLASLQRDRDKMVTKLKKMAGANDLVGGWPKIVQYTVYNIYNISFSSDKGFQLHAYMIIVCE